LLVELFESYDDARTCGSHTLVEITRRVRKIAKSDYGFRHVGLSVRIDGFS